MKAVVSYLLWFYFIYRVTLQEGDAASCSNGFPTRLVYSVTYPRSESTRLIPEMNFTCNGIIVGYTVAGNRGIPTGVVIQVWRENGAEPGVYYKISSGIVINESLCISEGQTETYTGTEVQFHCTLNKTAHRSISVQPGDVLGLELPQNSGLVFAKVTKGPTNYVFQRYVSSPLALSNPNYWKILPQVTLEIDSESEEDCTQGFPDIPAPTVSSYMRSSDVTLLIPEMNFTCNASIIGFAVAGMEFTRMPYSKIQIWRKNSSLDSVYYKVESISMNTASNGDVCVAGRIVDNTYWCILLHTAQISVQPGDILGLELQSLNNEIFFTKGGPGPENYVFQQQLGTNINISNNDNSYALTRQLPQIILNFTSDQCTGRFPSAITVHEGSGRGERTIVTTRLFPTLKFGCTGTIVKVTAAVRFFNKNQNSKLQIWRESATHPGLLYKTVSDITLDWATPPCYSPSETDGIFQCALTEEFRISVQPGDFLGLEIPPTNDDDLEIHFKSGGPTNHVFLHWLNSTVNLSDANFITNDLPLITFLVVLDETSHRSTNPTTIIPVMTVSTTQAKNVATTDSFKFSSVGGDTRVIAGSIIGGIITILLLVVIILLVAVLIQWRRRKQLLHTVESNERLYPNPIYDGSLTKQLKTSHKDDESMNYDHTKFNVKGEGVSLHTEDQTFSITPYEALEMQHYETTGPTLTIHEEPYIYWEPAKTVNDLHKQMSSNKYRELLRQQMEITKALGSGQFGVVSMGVWQSPIGAMEVAMKQLQSGVTETEKIRFLQEAAINGQFRHPNVVQLIGVVTKGEPAMIVLEFLSNGDLRNFLIKQQIPPKLESDGVDKHLLLQFCQHIASGMSYLASKAFVHRDLAARNILVSKNRTCKISDFGMSRDLLDENYYVSHGGMIPVKWTAPEAIHYKKYSTASDVWSFGCVMYEIWSLGHKPFESYNNPEVIKMIDKGCRLPPPPGLSKELYKIMIQCWQPKLSHRPTFPQLVELLSRTDFELFLWEEEDLRNSDPRVKEIGAPLETTMDLYPELQKMYLGKQ